MTININTEYNARNWILFDHLGSRNLIYGREKPIKFIVTKYLVFKENKH